MARRPLGQPFMLRPLGGDFLGFTLLLGRVSWIVQIPLWCPTALLAFVLVIAWRKTAQRMPERGFPVEPQASQREIV